MSHQAGSESTNVHEEGIRHLEEYYSEQQDQQREHQDGQEAESQVARLGGEEERTDVHEQQPDQEQEQEHVQEQEQEQVQEQELTLAQHVLEARDQVGSFDEQVEDARRLAIEAAEAALASGAGDFPQLTEHVEEEGYDYTQNDRAYQLHYDGEPSIIDYQTQLEQQQQEVIVDHADQPIEDSAPAPATSAPSGPEPATLESQPSSSTELGVESVPAPGPISASEAPAVAPELESSESTLLPTVRASKRPRQSTSGGPKDKKLKIVLTPELLAAKKHAHIISEQRRRAQIRAGYEALYNTVPALKDAALIGGAHRGGSGPGGGGAIGGRKRDREAMLGLRDGIESTSSKRKRGKGKKEPMEAEGESETAEDAGLANASSSAQVPACITGDDAMMDGRQGPRSESVALQKTIDYLREQHDLRLALKDRLEALRYAASKFPVEQQEALGLLSGPQMLEIEVPVSVVPKSTRRRISKSASVSALDPALAEQRQQPQPQTRQEQEQEQQDQPSEDGAVDLDHFQANGGDQNIISDEQGLEVMRLAMQMNDMTQLQAEQQQREQTEQAEQQDRQDRPQHELTDQTGDAAPVEEGHESVLTTDHANDGPSMTTQRVVVNFEGEWLSGKLIEGIADGE